jgi:hypothetical protein
MLSGDGTAFIAVDACAIHGPVCTVVDDGGVIEVAEDGTITAVLVSGSALLGFLDPSEINTPDCCSAEGTFFRAIGEYLGSGTWSVERKIPLPENGVPIVAPSWLPSLLPLLLD